MALVHTQIGGVCREATLSNARRMLLCGGEANSKHLLSAVLNDTDFSYGILEHICLTIYLNL